MGKKCFRSVQLGCLAVLVGCGRAGEQVGPPPPAQVVVSTPIKKSIAEWDEYVGRLEAVEFAEVRARVSGYLQSIHFEEGQIVEREDLLCVIDPRPFEAELNRAKAVLEEAKAAVTRSTAQFAQAEAESSSAEASLDYARRRYARSEALAPTNAISKDEVELHQSQLLQAQAEAKAAKARIESARAAIATATAAVETAGAAIGIAELNLQYTRVVAPITGRVSHRDVTEGNLISGGTRDSSLLTTIVSLDPIHCYFDADEQAFLKYNRLAREGKRQSSRDVKNPVYIALADENGSYPHKGHMDFVDNRLDPNTGTMRGRAIFANADLSLTPGLFARVRLPGSARYEAVLVPDSAVGSDQSEKFVLVVDDDNKIRRQSVKTGPQSGGLRIIRSGLDGSERVVLRGLQRVQVGMQVATEVESIRPPVEDGLPDDYEPVPKDQWLSAGREPASAVQPAWRGESNENSAHPPRISSDPPQP